jgi:hypothetical protein
MVVRSPLLVKSANAREIAAIEISAKKPRLIHALIRPMPFVPVCKGTHAGQELAHPTL